MSTETRAGTGDRRQLAVALCRKLAQKAENPDTPLSDLSDLALEIAEKLLEPIDAPSVVPLRKPALKIIMGGKMS